MSSDHLVHIERRQHAAERTRLLHVSAVFTSGETT